MNNSNIISVRVTDDEMKNIKRLIETTNKKASDIMRDAFDLMVRRFIIAEAARKSRRARFSRANDPAGAQAS